MFNEFKTEPRSILGMIALSLVIATAVTAILTAVSSPQNASNEGVNAESQEPTEGTSENVGDNQTYTYEITDVGQGEAGNEIYGEAISEEASEDNAGIFLYAEEVGFDVQPGDVISVVWGEHEDEFASITKVIQDFETIPEATEL